MTTSTLKSLFVPGGLLLLAAVLLLQTGVVPLSASAIHFYYYAVFLAGSFLAWRFHSSRILFALITVFLAYRALEFFSPGRFVPSGSGRAAFEAIAFLIPLNLVFIAFVREKGLAISSIAPRLGLLFFESVFVAVICRPGENSAPDFVHRPIFGPVQFHWTRIPQLAIVIFAIAFCVLLLRLLLYHKPVENGLLWSTAATFLGLHAGGLGKAGNAYFATAGLILVSSIVENSYALAYQDELTGLPSRRAFNDALLGLTETYAIAVVDIDHFKSFNDTYGHETGDQVLRLVAGRLAAVTGGGKSFRVGGEEFSILFPGKSTKDVLEHLEALRTMIEASRFRLRTIAERRAETRGSDRRNAGGQKAAASKPSRTKLPEREAVTALSVTVSIGVAESSAHTREAEQVIQSADKALYRAKRAGRNRVEVFRASRPRARRAGRSIAS